jgi:hypothetical protein
MQTNSLASSSRLTATTYSPPVMRSCGVCHRGYGLLVLRPSILARPVSACRASGVALIACASLADANTPVTPAIDN